jgi:murein DD-endopeptidase MepM/ murein hydrolase activator NlpD
MHDENPPGTWHVVKAGETPAQIAQDAGIPVEDLLEINGLRRGQDLEPGRLVFVLAPQKPTGKATVPEQSASGTSGEGEAPLLPSAKADKAPLRWPMAAPVLSSLFGKRWGREHEGIDMSAPPGTPVLAAADGEVIYAGNQVRGYGNMVVVQHTGGMLTVYAHNSVLLVKTGDRVSVGKPIAKVGSTGHSTGPHLHFEVRRGESPQDPLPFLPPLK